MELLNRETGKRVTADPFLSRMSRMRRRVKKWSEILDFRFEHEKHRLIMVTLTYAPEFEWEKRHVTEYLQALKRYLKDDLLGYAWTAELQQRGAIHYHILIMLNRGVEVPHPDDSGMWKWGMSNIVSAKSPYYLVKYLGKEYQKNGDFPKGIRIFAVWFQKGFLSNIQLWRLRLTSLPAWLRTQLEKMWWLLGLYPKRMLGGGWYVTLPKERAKLIGKPEGYEEIFISPWIVVNEGISHYD
jgi:hypothetical protein